jgi:hypothetical protein
LVERTAAVLGLAKATGVFGKGDVGGVKEEVAMMEEARRLWLAGCFSCE